MIERGEFIGSAKAVVHQVKEELDIDVKPWYVLKQLHAQGLKYKKLKPITTGSKSAKTLVLRQQYALRFLQIDFKHKTVINVDESWLNQADFR